MQHRRIVKYAKYASVSETVCEDTGENSAHIIVLPWRCWKMSEHYPQALLSRDSSVHENKSVISCEEGRKDTSQQ